MNLTIRAGVIAAVLLLVLANGIYAQHDYIPGVYLKPLSLPRLAGPAKLEFGLILKYTFDSVAFIVKTEGGLSYNGPMQWVNHQKGESTFTYVLDVVIPPNDTSGIDVVAPCCNGTTIYFVTTGDTLEVYRRGRPKSEPKNIWPNPPPPPKPVPPRDTVLKGPFKISDEEMAQRAKDRPKSHVIGKKLPVSKQKGNIIRDNDKERERRQEQAKDRDTVGQIILDLRKPADYDYAKEAVRDLTPMPDSGFYHGRVSKAVLQKLIEKKINYSPYYNKNAVDSSGYRRQNKKEMPPPIGAAETLGWQTLWQDDFEGPLQWATEDWNASGGYDTWDKIDITYSWAKVSGGTSSAWCSMQGQRSVIDQYDYFLHSFLSAGFIAPGADTACLEYDLWYVTAAPYDYMDLTYSFNDSIWYPLSARYFGNSNGWKYGESWKLPLQGHDTFYIAFHFFSEGWINASGVFIDNFKVDVHEPDPDLIPYVVPSWSDCIVADFRTGTHISDSVFAGKATYIDFAILNDGNGAAPPFSARLLLDNSTISDFNISASLQPGSYAPAIDYQTNIAFGWHWLKLVVDPNNLVPEQNDNNNRDSVRFFWDSLSVQITATASYRDMNPGGIQHPVRGAIVELWDKNNGVADVKLAPKIGIDSTDYYGYVNFGGFKDYDTEGQGRWLTACGEYV